MLSSSLYKQAKEKSSFDTFNYSQAPMEFSLPFSTTTSALCFAFVVFLYYTIVISTKANRKKNKPPEVSGAWPLIGHLFQLGGPKPLHITFGNLADKYGPIFSFKFGVYRTVVISSWEMAKECFTTNDKAFANRPKALAMEILGYNFSMFGFSQYGTYWHQVRKIATLELLSNHRLEMLKHVRVSEVKAFTKELYQFCTSNNKQRVSLTADMKRWFSNVTTNIIFKAIVGKRIKEYPTKPEDIEMERLGETLRSFLEWSGKFVVSDALPFLRWLDLGGCEKAMKMIIKELDEFMQIFLEEHQQKRDSGKVVKGEEDFMDVMLSILYDDKDWPRHKADTVNKATSLALVLAGAETTLVTLVWTLSLLLNHRETLKKVQDELDTQIGRERQVEESDMNNLVYLQAVIKESFRLYPAAPLSVPHESMEECTVGGFHIPIGTRLFLNIAKVHRDPRVWSEPDEFKPERFLTTHKDIDFRGQNFELLPFGSGRRICPGISFAHQVLMLTLASLLHGFEIETPSNEPVDMTETSGITNIKASPLDVLLTPRLPTYLY